MLPDRTDLKLWFAERARGREPLNSNEDGEELKMAYLRKNFLNIMMLIWVIGMILSVATARAEASYERSCGPERQCVALFPLKRSGVIF
jgi:hypothetical protein